MCACGCFFEHITKVKWVTLEHVGDFFGWLESWMRVRESAGRVARFRVLVGLVMGYDGQRIKYEFITLSFLSRSNCSLSRERKENVHGCGILLEFFHAHPPPPPAHHPSLTPFPHSIPPIHTALNTAIPNTMPPIPRISPPLPNSKSKENTHV